MLLVALIPFVAAAAAGRPSIVDLQNNPGTPLREVGDPPCTLVPPVTELPSPLPAKLKEALQQVNETFAATLSPSTPGVVAQVAFGGEPLATIALGFANVSSSQPVSADDTLFRIASVSKVFPAIVMWQLAAAGKLNVDEPISVKVPDFSPLNRFGNGQATWRQMASQLSGLQREAPVADNTSAVLQALRSSQLVWPPGAQPSYSNLGFALLGHLLAQHVEASGEDFSALATRLVIKPLNMTNTGFNYTADVQNRLAAGYVGPGVAIPLYAPDFGGFGWQYPCGGMFSTAADLSKLAQALMQAANPGGPSGPLAGAMPPSVARSALSAVWVDDDRLHAWGTPWETRLQGNFKVRRKGGNLAGFSALLAFVPELQLSVTATWNGGADEYGASNAAMEALLPALNETLTALMPEPMPNPGPNGADYKGLYTFPNAKPVVVLYNTSGRGELVMQIVGLVGVYLQAVEGPDVPADSFIAYVPPALSTCFDTQTLAVANQLVYFVRDGAGKVTHVSMPGFYPGADWKRQALPQGQAAEAAARVGSL